MEIVGVETLMSKRANNIAKVRAKVGLPARSRFGKGRGDVERMPVKVLYASPSTRKVTGRAFVSADGYSYPQSKSSKKPNMIEFTIGRSATGKLKPAIRRRRESNNAMSPQVSHYLNRLNSSWRIGEAAMELADKMSRRRELSSSPLVRELMAVSKSVHHSSFSAKNAKVKIRTALELLGDFN